MDMFIGGGGDDLQWLGLGVVRDYAATYSRLSGQPNLYLPNARTGRAVRMIEAAVGRGEVVNIIGHSWGAVDAYAAAVAARRRGLTIANLVTLDPVSGLWRRPPKWSGGVFWLNVGIAPSVPDASDRLSKRRPFAVKPSRLPTHLADGRVVLDLNHRDVEPMMRISGAQTRLLQAARHESGNGPFARTFENHGFNRHYALAAEDATWQLGGETKRARTTLSFFASTG